MLEETPLSLKAGFKLLNVSRGAKMWQKKIAFLFGMLNIRGGAGLLRESAANERMKYCLR